MFERRSTEAELLDDSDLNESAIQKNLDELELCNRWFGSETTLIDALNKIYQRYSQYFDQHEVEIFDLGCGSGDLLRNINEWAKSQKNLVKLTGLDVNPVVLNYAKSKTAPSENIHFQILNMLSSELALLQCDIVTLNSVCHHFTEPQLVQLLKQLTQQTRYAIIINDLHRHYLSYYGFKVLSKLLRFSYVSQHDGSLSILRAFCKSELVSILQQAGIKHYEIHRKWLYRWQLIIWSYQEL